jgi:hypothetical protein
MSAFLAIADVLNPQKWDNFNWGYTSPAESLQVCVGVSIRCGPRDVK